MYDKYQELTSRCEKLEDENKELKRERGRISVDLKTLEAESKILRERNEMRQKELLY